MPRRTDSRSRMIHAAAELFRQRGYHATTFSDLVRDSGAPRGSTYFHFPGGKAELAREAIARAGDELEEMVDAPRDGEFSADFDSVFARWRAALVARFEPLGIAPDRAAVLADLTMSALEGALVLSRAARSIQPFTTTTEALISAIDHAAAAQPAAP